MSALHVVPKLSQEGRGNCAVIFLVAVPMNLTRDYLREEGFDWLTA